MERVVVTILGDGDQVVLDNVPATVLVTQSSGRASWSGTLLLPAESPLQTGVYYRLRTPDGRSGVITVFEGDTTLRRTGGNATEVQFNGFGPFG